MQNRKMEYGMGSGMQNERLRTTPHVGRVAKAQKVGN